MNNQFTRMKRDISRYGCIGIIFLVLIFMAACSDNDDNDYTVLSGTFVDSAVKGLNYKTPTQQGITDENGTFKYMSNESITFSVGNIQLGETVPAKAEMNPIDLVPGATDLNDPCALNIVRFLQTLDGQGNTDDGIQIPESVRNNAMDESLKTINFADSEGASFAAITATQILSTLYEGETAIPDLVPAGTAIKHFAKSFPEQVRVTVTRDEQGVWYLKAPENESLYNIFEAVGYEVATDRLWQLETSRRAGLGKLSEIMGPGYLPTDTLMLSIGYSKEELETEYENLDQDSKDVIKGYVDGINRRIDDVINDRSLMPLPFVALGHNFNGFDFLPSKWSETDLLAWNVLVQRQFDPEALVMQKNGQLENARMLSLLSGTYGNTAGMIMLDDLRWTGDPDAPTFISEEDVPNDWKVINNKRQKQIPTNKLFCKIPDYTNTVNSLNKFMSAVKNNLETANANVKIGCYAWVIGPEKTSNNKPILYAGPQMAFESPSKVIECSIDAGGLKVSGMMIPGVPGILIGRTPHHAWSMQTGHAHTTDFYFDYDPQNATEVAKKNILIYLGSSVESITTYEIDGRPIISPSSFDPSTYTSTVDGKPNPIVSWRYSHAGHEFKLVSALLDFARAQSISEFGEGIEKVGFSQHYCYADTNGDIAYWMSGRDPVRSPAPLDVALQQYGLDLGYQLPQGAVPAIPMPDGGLYPIPKMDWDNNDLRPRSHCVNPTQNYFAGWNDRSHPYYPGSQNTTEYNLGPFHRSHVIHDYLKNNNNLTYEDVRDLALNIATTDSVAKGGNPWASDFVKGTLSGAIALSPTTARNNALATLNSWDGHFVEGGKEEWANGKDRAYAWMLMDTWIKIIIDKVFLPHISIFSENGTKGNDSYLFGNELQRRLFNVILRSFKGRCKFDWFNKTLMDPTDIQGSSQRFQKTAFRTIQLSLDEALSKLEAEGGEENCGKGKRGEIKIVDQVVSLLSPTTISGLSKSINDLEASGVQENLVKAAELRYANGLLMAKTYLWKFPFANRSAYAQCVQIGSNGPDRIESFFPIGQSGHIYWHFMLDAGLERFLAPHTTKVYHSSFFSMIPYFDTFTHRNFPLFDVESQ